MRVLHDRGIPGSRANLDHVVVCPSGGYVVDAKRYQGRPQHVVEGGLFTPRKEKLLVGLRDCTKLVEAGLKQAGLEREALADDDVAVHKYAVQITVADVRDGACSSSTLKEACSWGKVDVTWEQMVFAEATTVIPLIASNAWHLGAHKARKKRRWADLFNKAA